ncbi:receptor-type tyrosine-protein phosphatase T-like isoform X2 [Ceratina calcarata]|uniref:protein-tyrosine-phosphatase n=1 Tax=Ceratina calcarata TaxID=156304 RepID=A0AAJ7RX37_9HYME|nr:receptor-type tyrosine-protein phosphatase T-like isoform X2 [Ceratina calcarata]
MSCPTEAETLYLNAYKKEEIDCDLNAHDNCMETWNATGWNLTNSRETPMGPVLDRRWEGFREYNNFGSLNEYRLLYKLRKSGTFVVSIRGSTDAHILLCDTEQYNLDFCYWIIIGGWSNKESVIRKCAMGVPQPMTFPIEPTCAQIRASYFYETLSATEWKTFIITWDENSKTISVYDTEKLLMSYIDNDGRSRERTSFYNLFVRSPKYMLFRFHTYSFFYTTDLKSELTSPVLNIKSRNLCIELIIGLCAECKMEIMLVDSIRENNQESLEIVEGSRVNGVHKLATWQYVRINKTISADLGKSVKIKLIPGVEDMALSELLFAVANVRKCPPVDTLRYSTMEATQDYHDYKYFWPNVTCQKLSYNESILVNVVSDVKIDQVFDDTACPKGKVGPYCSINCYEHLENNADCRGTVICDTKGCTCPAGFLGTDCHSYCDVGQYGYGCNETCGLCLQDNCDFLTGYCTTGCDNSKRFYVPPFCKRGIDAPSAPKIDFINETVVRVILPMKEEYKLLPSGYQYVLQRAGMLQIGDYNEISNNSSIIMGYFDRLEPGISYRISCTLTVNNHSIHGEWANFATRCASTTNFVIQVGNTSLTLTKNKQVDPLYSCPSKWYDFLFENIETSTEISRGSLTKLPYEFTHLIPYTLYKITVSKGIAVLFSQQVRTLDGAPSEVRNVSKIFTSNEEIILKWYPPLYPNGNIREYRVALQIKTYFGCDDLKIQSPKNDSVIISTTTHSVTFSDLRPYTSYVAEIVAYTSHRGLKLQVEFSTNQTEMPTTVYTNLRFHDYVLMWDAPQDCTTISGPIIARINITGVGKAVANHVIIKQTVKYSLNLDSDLLGSEMYEARIYAIRDYNKQYNPLRYNSLTFTTPPKAPPPVRSLEIYETDFITKHVHLRWLEPKPPMNGELASYIVSQCQLTCKTILEIRAADRCDLWSTHICATVKQLDPERKYISVSAMNVNVSMPGDAIFVQITWTDITPEAPETFLVENLEDGVVNLTWTHPWRTGEHLQKFIISVQMISSNLRMEINQSQRGVIHEYKIEKYQLTYNEKLYLLPSSAYKISIQAVTIAEVYGETKVTKVETSLAIKFENELRADVRDSDSMILLHIPKVLNDTKQSTMHVIVKGSQACTDEKLPAYLSEKTGIEHHDEAWYAASFPNDELAGKTFVIGDNKIYGSGRNCPLKPTESYVIAIVVLTDEKSMNGIVAKTASIRIGEVPRQKHGAWLIPITIILIIGATIFYFYQRRKRSSKKVDLQREAGFVYNSKSSEVKLNPSCSSRSLTSASTLSDKELLSRVSTPHDGNAMNVNDINNHQREERMSLVKVKDFEDYVRQVIDSGLLDKQYSTLPRGQTKPWEYGKLAENKPKNRYANLIAYDENRVVLEKLPDDPYSDYINANYIKGYKKDKFYIATQGPKANTVIDFWRMVWQEEAYVICMIANLVEGGKTKCEQYWPDTGKKKKYGDIIVFNANNTVFAHYTIRTLHVSYGDEARKIEHLHYTAWPDHGIPLFTHSVVTYLKKLLATPLRNGPVVVHCSAGVGRTGTIILCDICLRRAAAEGVIDVFSEAKVIRSQRPNMVDNKQQYLLAHLILVESLLSLPTSLPCNESLPAKIKSLKEHLEIQRDSLEKVTWQDKALRPPTNQQTLSERNLAKNRFPELVSANVNRLYLKRYPPTDEDSDYIAAVYVDGVRLQNQYLATQLPMPTTFSDFWRMIAEYKVELIIVLQPPDLTDTTCCPIVPCGEFKPVPYINIRAKEFTESEHYTTQGLILIDNSEKPVTEQEVTILCSTKWKAGRNQDPPETMSLVTLWKTAMRISREEGPIVVLCHDGVTGCGLYLALSFLLKRMTIESECDVCLAIRTIRKSRPDFVNSLEQMEYLYDAAITYLMYFENSETYANFP